MMARPQLNLVTQMHSRHKTPRPVTSRRPSDMAADRFACPQSNNCLNYSCYKASCTFVITLVKKPKQPVKHAAGGVTIQLNLIGLIIFSVALVAASALLTFGLVRHASASNRDEAASTITNTEYSVTELKEMPPWGQLITRELDLEQPEEYVAYEVQTNKVETWTFEGMTPEAAKTVMQNAGLGAAEIARVMQPATMAYAGSSTVITPDKELVFSMPPATRAKLYAVLGQSAANELIHFPFCFPGNSFQTRLDKSRISPETFALLEKMLYPRGDALCFSDLPMLLHETPGDVDRLQLVKALSHQSALLIGIHVWPDSDIDKLMGYWTWPSGVRLLNVRPLLESLKRRPAGGSASILYFLPPFARARLYTYPLPSQPGDPTMDCHWTTMNFFNEIPDNQFANPVYTVNYLRTNYYQIAKPTAYGDRIFLLDKNGNAIHSAVYLADDIVFTKNGNNFAQPWMLMRLGDLMAEYTSQTPPGVAIYRNKNW